MTRFAHRRPFLHLYSGWSPFLAGCVFHDGRRSCYYLGSRLVNFFVGASINCDVIRCWCNCATLCLICVVYLPRYRLNKQTSFICVKNAWMYGYLQVFYLAKCRYNTSWYQEVHATCTVFMCRHKGIYILYTVYNLYIHVFVHSSVWMSDKSIKLLILFACQFAVLYESRRLAYQDVHPATIQRFFQSSYDDLSWHLRSKPLKINGQRPPRLLDVGPLFGKAVARNQGILALGWIPVGHDLGVETCINAHEEFASQHVALFALSQKWTHVFTSTCNTYSGQCVFQLRRTNHHVF